MNAYVKEDTTREVPILNFIRQKGPLMCLKKCAWGPRLDSSIGQQVVAASKATGAPLGL